jgi:hypothetical protein
LARLQSCKKLLLASLCLSVWNISASTGFVVKGSTYTFHDFSTLNDMWYMPLMHETQEASFCSDCYNPQPVNLADLV